ncbi:MAG: UvrD-helicase domain-containing protein, partial [Acidobacteria bacterium]|nr:UvrD-helicase domain-containing protein [Acidobacteriota bacterium]
MPRFHADLHVHSKYSRATSRDLDLEHLSHWACRKGVAVVGTGDFTHPGWRAEIKDKLVPAEPGLFRLRSDIERVIAGTLPATCRTTTRFMLTVEISTIYKKGDRTRKIHHLIYAPDFETAEAVAARLARIGNIASDGRPILGLDSRDLLEIALESHPDAYLVPAHIWTPWFAALGSQSGFDSIVECYRDLSDRIFAVETGLSSDPPMNWRLSQLDRYRLVSNSDAHSPGKLGREATVFDGELDYFAIKRALETGQGYVGTVEFFPEEGKYHLDGHRKCGIRWTPQETLERGNRCPICGQPTTIGVLHRVEALADRAEATPPQTAGEVSNMVPLPEVLSEIAGTGPSSQTVARSYDRLVSTLGAELSILRSIPVEDIERASSSLLAEAISRLRAGHVIREAGYDGEYGVIRLFEESELRRLTVGGALFDENARRQPDTTEGDRVIRLTPETTPDKARRVGLQADHVQPPLQLTSGSTGTLASVEILAALDDEQRRAAETIDGPLMILAGPGSGKTRTLTHRIAHLIAERDIPPSACLAITFTRRAAAEMRERLARLLAAPASPVAIHTFHSLGLTMLREQAGAAGLHRDFRVAGEPERLALLAEQLKLSSQRAGTVLRAISKAKRTQETAGA